jgi:hypothetical protein
MMDHASLRVEMLNMRTFRPHFGIEASGVFANLSEGQWKRGVDRLCASQGVCMEQTGFPIECHQLEHLYLLPLMVQMEVEGKSPSAVFDLGCGASTLIRDAVRSGAEKTLGVDLANESAQKGIHAVSCQFLDLRDLDRALREGLEHTGGLLACTEVLEHLPYNPLPAMVMIVERLMPDRIYLTAPTLWGGDFMAPWVHYSRLPTWRGEWYQRGTWHFKAWMPDEMLDLVTELGFRAIGNWAGQQRCGILAESRR